MGSVEALGEQREGAVVSLNRVQLLVGQRMVNLVHLSLKGIIYGNVWNIDEYD